MVDMNIPAFRRLMKAWHPEFVQPATDGDAEVTLHMARTASERVPFDARAYSHAWLVERNLPSQLPDALRPKAQRIYPVPLYGVGVMVEPRNPLYRPAAKIIERAMCDAVMEADADGKLLDTPFVKARMDEARRRTIDKLFG
jgi:hypothetical protein